MNDAWILGRCIFSMTTDVLARGSKLFNYVTQLAPPCTRSELVQKDGGGPSCNKNNRDWTSLANEWVRFRSQYTIEPLRSIQL